MQLFGKDRKEYQEFLTSCLTHLHDIRYGGDAPLDIYQYLAAMSHKLENDLDFKTLCHLEYLRCQISLLLFDDNLFEFHPKVEFIYDLENPLSPQDFYECLSPFFEFFHQNFIEDLSFRGVNLSPGPDSHQAMERLNHDLSNLPSLKGVEIEFKDVSSLLIAHSVGLFEIPSAIFVAVEIQEFDLADRDALLEGFKSGLAFDELVLTCDVLAEFTSPSKLLHDTLFDCEFPKVSSSV